MSFIKLFKRPFINILLSLMVSDLAKSVGSVLSILKLSLTHRTVNNLFTFFANLVLQAFFFSNNTKMWSPALYKNQGTEFPNCSASTCTVDSLQYSVWLSFYETLYVKEEIYSLYEELNTTFCGMKNKHQSYVIYLGCSFEIFPFHLVFMNICFNSMLF